MLRFALEFSPYSLYILSVPPRDHVRIVSSDNSDMIPECTLVIK